MNTTPEFTYEQQEVLKLRDELKELKTRHAAAMARVCDLSILRSDMHSALCVLVPLVVGHPKPPEMSEQRFVQLMDILKKGIDAHDDYLENVKGPHNAPVRTPDQ